MKKNITTGTLLFFMAGISFFAWSSVDRAINISGASVWAVPLLLFSLWIVIFFLGAILIREIKLLGVLIFLALIPSLIFAGNLMYIAHLIVGAIFLFLASVAVMRELNLSVRISSHKAFKAGGFMLILAMSFIIAAQYFFEVRNFDLARQIPKLPTQEITNLIVPKILSITNPEFKSMNKDNLTVDQFILNTQATQLASLPQAKMSAEEMDKIIDEQVGKNISPAQRVIYRKEIEKQASAVNTKDGVAQDFILVQGRKQLSDMAGIELFGDERIADVIAGKIDRSISDFVIPILSSQSSFPAVPVVMALILFLSVFSLGSFVNSFLTIIASAIFLILVKTKIVSIGTVVKEVEIIE
jgi:hypothetical protein